MTVEAPEHNGTQSADSPKGPPWAYVPLEAVNNELRQQVAAQAEEMAAMRVYIGQLHQALAQLAEGRPDAGLVPPGEA